jgi:hypothetical protein
MNQARIKLESLIFYGLIRRMEFPNQAQVPGGASQRGAAL